MFQSIFQHGGFILPDAAKRPLLRMRSQTLMVRSTAKPRVSNYEAGVIPTRRPTV
jgi:hypothetical protein